MNRSPATVARLGLAAGIALVLAAAAGPLRAQDEPPRRYVDLVFERVERTNGVKYGSAIDKPTGRSVDLLLDIYEPAGDTAAERPVFVFLFGGGFVAGDRMREPRAYCEQMARRGYVSVAIDYRLNQGNIFTDGIPAAVSDARQAVRWLRENATRYRLDVERIAIGGSSAGSITSLFLAYTDMERSPGDQSSEVAIVLDLWGGLYNEVRQMEAGEPPLVIIHGTEDRIVPFSEAEKLRDRAEVVGLPHLYHPLEGQGHAPYMPVELMAVAAPFFYQQLWPGGAVPTATPAPTDTPTATPAPTETPTAVVTAPPTSTPIVEPTTPPTWRVYLPMTWRE
jgi:acetyl esterase/lipase